MRILTLFAAGLYALSAGSMAAHAGVTAGLAEADSLAARGKVTQALARYQAIAKADPNSARAHEGLGGMQLVQQRYRDAIGSFQTAITLDSKRGRSFVGLGIAYLHMGNYALARAALNEAKARHDVSQHQEIDRVLAWLDKRQRKSNSHAMPAMHPKTSGEVKK